LSITIFIFTFYADKKGNSDIYIHSFLTEVILFIISYYLYTQNLVFRHEYSLKTC